MNPRWRYQVVELKEAMTMWGGSKPEVIQEELNKQGIMGWELVTVISQPMKPVVLYFKREG